jgi:hypothetical protein
VATDGDGLVVSAAADRSWELSAALAGRSVHVAELRVLETSLEEYFLEVTE